MLYDWTVFIFSNTIYRERTHVIVHHCLVRLYTVVYTIAIINTNHTTVETNVIAQVTEPTPWVSSMVVVQKNNKIKICLDPEILIRLYREAIFHCQQLNKWQHNWIKVKVLTVLDAKTGFWQVKLDQQSSYLTTFNTPFGRYRWLRMPFGINSAPEVWQQRMTQIVEGLNQVEVIADDFLIHGVVDTTEEAITNHDLVLQTFRAEPVKED